MRSSRTRSARPTRSPSSSVRPKTSRSRRRPRAARRSNASWRPKADILAALRADIAALEAAPPSEEPCAQIAAWPHPAEDDAVCGRDTGASCAQDLSRSSRGEERESALSGEEGKTARDAYQKILRWAAVRERSTAYLRERLLKDDFPAAVVEEALQRAVRVRARGRSHATPTPSCACSLRPAGGFADAEREIEELGIDPATARFLRSSIERKGRRLRSGPRPGRPAASPA